MNKDGSEIWKPSQERLFREGTRPPGLKVAHSPSRDIALILSFGDEHTNRDGVVIKYQNRKGSSVWSHRKVTPSNQLRKHYGHRNGWKGKSIKNKPFEGRYSESSIMQSFSKCSLSWPPALYSSQTLSLL